MKLGGSVVGSWKTSEDWAKLLQSTGFAAIPCPVDSNTDRTLAREVIAAIRERGVVIAEVGVWRNVLAPDPAERDRALRYAKAQLTLAEEYGIPCCVNIAGAPGPRHHEAQRVCRRSHQGWTDHGNPFGRRHRRRRQRQEVGRHGNPGAHLRAVR